MAVEYEISSDVATIKDVASNTQLANIVKFYTGSITYDDEPTSKYASVTINGKTQRVMLCVAVSGTVNYDDVPCLFSTVSGHRALNVVEPTESGTPDDVPSLYETVVVNGKTVRALRCVLISATPNYDGVSSTCTFTDNGKTHTAQLINQVSSSSIETIVKGVSPLSLPDAVANSLSYVKAFGGTEQRNLPVGYTQLEYIESTGTQYIDTGYFFTDIATETVTLDFMRTGTGAGSLLYGTRKAYKDNGYAIQFQDGGNTYMQYGEIDSGIGDSAPGALNTRYTLIQTGPTYSFRDASYTSTGATPTQSYPLYLFTTNNGGNPSALTPMRVYSFVIKDRNNSIKLHLVPAKNSSGVVGMYDTVNNRFYTNAGTGDFAAGPTAVPTPDAPIDIVSNNGVLKARHASGLPLGYTLLEYIGTAGGSYIDTGITPTINAKADVKFAPTQTSALGYWGARSDPNRFCCTTFSSGTKFGIGMTNNTWPANRTPVTLESIYDCVVANGYASVNGAEYTETPVESFGNAGTFYLGRIGAAKYYKCKLWENNVLVFDGIPAKNANDVIGMYDLVSGQFFTNQGAGDFTAGDPVSDPVEIYTDGTVETVEVTGKNIFDKNTMNTQRGWYITDVSTLTIGDVPSSNRTIVIDCKPNTNYSYWHTEGSGGGRAFDMSKDTIAVNDIANKWLGAPLIAEKNQVTTYTTSSTAKKLYILAGRKDNLISRPFEDQLADFMVVEGEVTSATPYEPYFNGGTATAEMLLKVGNYQDAQSIIDGVVTRNIGVKVLDGTEAWGVATTSGVRVFVTNLIGGYQYPLICTHFINGEPTTDNIIYIASGTKVLKIRYDTAPDVAGFKQWLADQYANGTPVTIVYPLAQAVTEQVAPQVLNVQTGDNILEITQASLSNLELEAKYSKSA